jgi:hypothetical protein
MEGLLLVIVDIILFTLFRICLGGRDSSDLNILRIKAYELMASLLFQEEKTQLVSWTTAWSSDTSLSR